VAAIGALSRIGRAESVSALENVAAGRAKYVEQDAREAAQKALPLVRIRVQHDLAHAALLRPVDAEPNLLRPASGAVSTDGAALLHVSDN